MKVSDVRRIWCVQTFGFSVGVQERSSHAISLDLLPASMSNCRVTKNVDPSNQSPVNNCECNLTLANPCDGSIQLDMATQVNKNATPLHHGLRHPTIVLSRQLRPFSLPQQCPWQFCPSRL